MFYELVQTVAHAQATIPVPQLLLALAILAFCLLLRLARVGLIVAYLYTYYLGWLFCAQDLMLRGAPYEGYAVGYLAFGGLLLLLSIAGMLFHHND